MPTELTQEELAAVEAGRKARGVTVPAVEAYKEAISHTEQPKGLDAINISSDGVVETTPVAAASEETTPTNGLKVVPIAEAKSQEVKLDNKIDPNVAPSADSIYLANAFNDYVNSIYGEDQRIADEKRKKAAKWITAAQMLGDSIGALGNVYWTGKGATAQKFEAGAPKAGAATYQMEQDIRNAREKAAKAKMDATLKKYEMEMQRQDKKQAQENWQKTFDANEAHRAQQQKNFETTEARLAEQARLNTEKEKILMEISRQNANIQLKNSLDKNKPYPMAVNGEIYEIPINKVNEQIIGSIFAKLPEEVRKSAGSPRYSKDLIGNPVIAGYDTPSLADMLAAIGTYGNEETAKEIMKLAGVKVGGASAANPKAQTSDGTYVSAPIDATKNAGSMGGYGSAADWVSGAMDNVRKMLLGNGTMDIKDAENKWSGSVIENKE